MSVWSTCLRFLAALPFFGLCIGCHRLTPSTPTVDGPEATDLISAVEGHLVWTRPRGELRVVHLPSREQTVLREPAPSSEASFPVIHSISGPDSEGRIAYIEDWFFVTEDRHRKHVLKTMRVDGTQDQEIFERKGSAMWSATAAGDGRIGSQLALAPTGGRVALVTDIDFVQMDDPSAHLTVGSLEVWSTTTKSHRTFPVKVLDQATRNSSELSWFPDGIHLAYVELVSRVESEATLRESASFGSGFHQWPRMPAVHVLNVDTGERRFLHLGWSPVVSADGDWVVVSDGEGRLTLIDANEGASKSAHFAGIISGPGVIAVLQGGLALYWGWPTTGTAIQYTDAGSSGRHALVTIKVGEVNSQRFQTAIPSLDARHRVSFGGSIVGRMEKRM
jgi:hypothetical protein